MAQRGIIFLTTMLDRALTVGEKTDYLASVTGTDSSIAQSRYGTVKTLFSKSACLG